jgi:transcription antitermination protein NusB
LTNDPLPKPSSLDDIDIEDELKIPSDEGQERTIARRLALQILYEVDTAEHPLGEVMANHLSRYALRNLTVDHTSRLVHGVIEYQDRLDMIIQTVASDFPLDEVAAVDRNVLRMALYEGAMIDELPVGIVLQEAVKLTETFAGDSSIRFVNGVLGGIFNNPERLAAMLAVEIPDDDEDDDDA